MQMKEYLIDTFRFNDRANREILRKITEIPEPDECVRFFSHLINSQRKWMARILQDPNAPGMSWWDPYYSIENLLNEWEDSLQAWIRMIEEKTEEEILAEVEFSGFDGARWSAKFKDIALQLNYHSIHHRAQIQALIRSQGLQPDFVDYIGTVYRRIG